MFIRKKKNKSGSVSIQIIDKFLGKFNIIKVVGCARNEQQQEDLIHQVNEHIAILTGQSRIDFLSSALWCLAKKMWKNSPHQSFIHTYKKLCRNISKSQAVKLFWVPSLRKTGEDLIHQANEHIAILTGQSRIDFKFSEDELFLKQIQQGLRKVVVIGPELILGKIFNEIGYDKIHQSLFRHLVITRLIYPGSKLKTVDYLLHYKGLYANEDRIYRYMDRFDKNHKETAIALTYDHTKKILNNQISIAFYDITTLYFEASDEDDLRKTGFSKDGKAQNPQILLALLVGVDGQPLA